MKRTGSLAKVFAFLSAGMSALLLVRLRTPSGFPLWPPKLLAAALSPYLAILGFLGAVLGALGRVPLALLSGSAGLALSARYVWRVVTSFGDFDRAFGRDWQRRIPAAQAERMLKGRWTWSLASPTKPRSERDVAFWTIPGSTRQLLCDVWRPPEGVSPSGMAVLYFHGSAWYLGDKDLGTRTFFRHLAAQGHVVVDVAYRLCPEVDVRGMVGDVKRAVAWIKAHAADYGVNPERIVLMGASAGAHLALLAAYAPHHPELMPEELQDVDLSVRAVVSFYGPVDLCALVEAHPRELAQAARYTGPTGPVPLAQRTLPKWAAFQMAQWRRSGNIMNDLLGGLPDQVPHMYDLASPIRHVRPGCPPTLLIHGGHDMIVPPTESRALYQKLQDAGVPAVYLELPQTDHAFDLVLPRLSPPAQVALYEVERFLALT